MVWYGAVWYGVEVDDDIDVNLVDVDMSDM